MIPIAKSLLYIAPLYVEATGSTRLPQLQRVIVAFGRRVVMEWTLEVALARLFPGYAGGEGETEAPSAPPVGGIRPVGPAVNVPADVRALIGTAAQQYGKAQERLKAGDFAGYGKATEDLKDTLNRLKSLVGGRTGGGAAAH